MDYFTGYPLLAAAREGNVEFLIESLDTQPPDYFLTRSMTADGRDEYNIIHVAITSEVVEFLRQALERLPSSDVQLLLCQEVGSFRNYNAFHFAALQGNFPIVKLLVEFAKSSLSSSSSSSSPLICDSKPWLALDSNGMTPSFVALNFARGECALELMSLDMELLCNMVDNRGTSPLLQAVRGSAKVAVKILTSGLSYSTSSDGDFSPLDEAPRCSEEVCKLLLDKHPEMIKKVDKNGLTLLHKWVEIGEFWPFDLLLNRGTTSGRQKDIINLLCMAEKSTGNNPLHSAAYKCTEGTDVLVTQALVKAYIDAYKNEKGDLFPASPWERFNNKGETPLITALIHKHEKLALYYMSVDVQKLVIHATKSVLYAAVWNGCDEVVQRILTSVHPAYFNVLRVKANEGQTVLHAASNCTEGTAKLLVDRFSGLIKEPDDNGKTPLDVASELGTAWLIKLLLKKEPSSFSGSAWIDTCEKGHLHAIEAFINYSPDFRTHCVEAKDSPLHHIQLRSYNQYQEFLAIPLIQEMKNMPDSNNSTPLHRALERKDILFAEILLTAHGVSRTIQDNSGNTATNLLVELCDQQDGGAWEAMCNRIGINPRLRINYIQPNTMEVGAGMTRAAAASAGEMRGILSVVAALLATLAFAAGFTIPGGLNEETGEALLGKKASFLVFILADTYAMCCSMLVLFFLMWSIVVGDQDKSLVLVDRSVLILIQALYGTLLAFMMGVFTVISQKSLWVAIVVFFMCSLVALVAVSANRAVLYKFLDKLAPSAMRKKRNQIRCLEEGTTLTSRGGDNSQKSE